MVVVVRERIMKKYVGNNLRVVLSENLDPLTFVGNNIRVKIQRNEGDINIVGDHCRMDVLSGAGKIKYTGNNGKFSFGQEETEKKFEYNGSNVSVKLPRENSSSCYQQDVKKEKPSENQKVYHHCCTGSNIFISNSKHVRINSTKLIRLQNSNSKDSSSCGCSKQNLV